MTASVADPASQIETLGKDLEEHQAVGGSQCLIGEADEWNGVETAQNLCFLDLTKDGFF